MHKTTIIFFIGLCLSISAQDAKLINKKTNGYLEIYDNNKKTSIHLVVKADKCTDTWKKIPTESKKFFIDSLNKSGWTTLLGTKDVTQDFSIKMYLDSVQNAVGSADSTFMFYYHIDIKSKDGSTYSIQGRDRTTQLKAVENAIKNQDFGKEVLWIDKTTIYNLTLSSFILFDSDRSTGSYRVGPYKHFYF